jgi:hypothetical protein
MKTIALSRKNLGVFIYVLLILSSISCHLRNAQDEFQPVSSTVDHKFKYLLLDTTRSLGAAGIGIGKIYLNKTIITEIHDTITPENSIKFSGASWCEFKDSIIQSPRVGLDTNVIHVQRGLIDKEDFGTTKIFPIGATKDSWIEISDFVSQSISIGVDYSRCEISHSKLNTLEFTSGLTKSLVILGTKIGSLKFRNLKFNHDQTIDGFIDSIFIETCNLKNTITLGDIQLPKFIYLNNLQFDSTNSSLDLTHFKISKENEICNLCINGMTENIPKIKLNYENFKLIFEKTTETWEKERIYRTLLDEQKRDNFTQGYQKLDRECQEFELVKDNTQFGIIHNFLEKNWWDYGYSKFKVITNSIYLFLFFILINLFLYPSFIKIYFPTRFKEFEEKLSNKYGRYEWASTKNKIKSKIDRFPAIILYTSYIFWGLKLDVKEIQLKKPLIFLIFMLEYLIGLVCLGYIANYIIAR